MCNIILGTQQYFLLRQKVIYIKGILVFTTTPAGFSHLFFSSHSKHITISGGASLVS